MSKTAELSNAMIESRLASAVSASAPDMLDSLMAELGLQETSQPKFEVRTAAPQETAAEVVPAVPAERIAAAASEAAPGQGFRKVGRRWNARALASCAAALLVVVGGASIWNSINKAVFAVVGLDVNPGIELSIDRNEKVIDATAVNDDGEAILSEMDLKGSNIKVACNAIVGAMLTGGYLNEESNSLLVSVYSEDPEKGQQIEAQLSDDINRFLDTTTVAAAIIGQYVDDDEALRAFADENGISLGKAWLIRKLLDSKAADLTEESLLALTTQELIFLCQELNIDSETSYGNADIGQYVGRDQALNDSIKHAGVDKSEVKDAEVEVGCDKGVIVYEVEFETAGNEYDYEVDASTGEVITAETDGKIGGKDSSSSNDNSGNADASGKSDDDNMGSSEKVGGNARHDTDKEKDNDSDKDAGAATADKDSESSDGDADYEEEGSAGSDPSASAETSGDADDSGQQGVKQSGNGTVQQTSDPAPAQNSAPADNSSAESKPEPKPEPASEPESASDNKSDTEDQE